MSDENISPADLLKRAQEEGSPVIQGDTAIFLWEGETAPEIVGDFNNWGQGPSGTAYMTQVARGVWTYSITLPPDAYVEYVFTADADDDNARLLDPLNRNQVANGLGRVNNHFLMPEGKHNDLDQFIPGVAQGMITRHSIFHDRLVIGGRRDVWLYKPPTREPVPLLLVYDGKDYMRLADITQTVANMISLGQIRPIALAMIDNARESRLVEYNCSESLLMAVTQLLLPMAYQHLNLIDHRQNPGAFGVMGASMGGLMALYTGMRLPHIFGKVISQSGAFSLRVDTVDPIIHKLIKDASKKDLKIWMDIGVFDGLLDSNRTVHELLNMRGYDVSYHEYNAGHNYTIWSDWLPEALKVMFAS